MARLAVELLDQNASAKLQETRRQHDKYREEYSDAQKIIQELESEQKETTRKLDALKKRVFYHKIEDAQQTVMELNSIIANLDIDIVGYKAMIDTIRKSDKLEVSQTTSRVFL